MAALQKALKVYNNIEKYTVIVMMSVMVIVIFSQVVSRYVFGHAIFWSEALGKFIFVWVSWLGVSAGLNEKEHIQVKLFPDFLKKKKLYRAEKSVYVLVDVIWFVTSIMIAWYGWQIVRGQLETMVYDPSTSIPIWIPYLCVPVCSLIVCIRLLGDLYKNIRGIVRNELPDASGEEKLPIDVIREEVSR